MQLEICFGFAEMTLPIDYRHLIQGMIFELLSKDKKYAKFLHDRGFESDGRSFKLFTFGAMRGRYTLIEKMIRFYGKSKLEIRSCDPHFINLILTNLHEGQVLNLGDNTVAVERIYLKDEKIFSDEIKIKTLTPITVYTTGYDGFTKYYSPKEKLFYELVTKNAERKWKSFHGNKSFIFSIEPLFDNEKYIKRVARYKTINIDVWSGSFRLRGTPEGLDFLFNVGLGGKNAEGFGMFEVIPNDIY